MYYQLAKATDDHGNEHLLMLIDRVVVSEWPFNPEEQSLSRIALMLRQKNQVLDGRDLCRFDEMIRLGQIDLEFVCSTII